MSAPDNPVLAATAAVARELADPIRLATLQQLTAEGPHSLTQLADQLRISAPRLANHLARLRDAGLVEVTHHGRHATYRVSRTDLAPILTALTQFAHGSPTTFHHSPTRADLAHTCYDHAAGRLGVRVFAQLTAENALSTPDGTTDELRLGANPGAFLAFGVDPATVAPGRRKLATACLDRTHRLPHLGGALGAAVLTALLRDRLVRPVEDSRDLTITRAGKEKLAALLGSGG